MAISRLLLLVLVVATATAQRPSVPARIAKHDAVKLWNGSMFPVVPTGPCQGSEGIKSLGSLANPTHRLTPEGNETYWRLYTSNRIDGWMTRVHPHIVRSVTERQWALQVFGSVGEIGVHHGKFLVPLVGSADAREPAVAIDLFEEGQKDNLDGSGKGSSAALVHNLKQTGLYGEGLALWQGNSLAMTCSTFASRPLPRFRMISVDGAHRVEATLHDLMLASCALEDGGVIILDDAFNAAWLGVVEAAVLFLNRQDKIVPFLATNTKLYLTTRAFHSAYLSHVQADPLIRCTNMHVSRRTLAGWEACYVRDCYDNSC